MKGPLFHPRRRVLLLLAQESIGGARRDRLMLHLDRCSECRHVYLTFGALDQVLSSPPQDELPGRLESRIQGALAAERARERTHGRWDTARVLRLAAMIAALSAVTCVCFYRSLYRPLLPPSPSDQHWEEPGIQPGPQGHAPASPQSVSRGGGPGKTPPPAPWRAEHHKATVRTKSGDSLPPAVPAPNPVRVAVIERVEGRPSVSRHGVPTDARPGATVLQGDEIRTDSTDRAMLRLPDGGQVVIGFDTTARLAPVAATSASGTGLGLLSGQVWAWSPGDGQAIGVETDSGVIEVHHGEALVRSSGPQHLQALSGASAEAIAFRGSVAFTDRDGRAIQLPEGHQLRIGLDSGAPRLEPQPLAVQLRVDAVWGTRHEMWGVRPVSTLELLQDLDAPRLWLGLGCAPVAPPRHGMQVVSVTPGSIAARAGVRPGDLLKSVGGSPTDSLTSLAAVQLALAASKTISFGIERDGEALDLLAAGQAIAPRLSRSGAEASASAAGLAAKGEFGAALAAMERLARTSPSDVSAWYNLGLLHEHGGSVAQALSCYQQAAQVSPNDATVLRALGRGYGLRGNAARASEALAKVVETSTDPKDRYLLGRVLLLSGRLEMSQQQAARLQASSRADGQAWGEVLSGQIVYLTRQDFAQAATDFARATQLDPTNVEATYYLALARMAMGAHEKARELLGSCLAAEPNSVRALALSEAVAYALRDFAEARRWADLALAVEPAEPFLLLNRSAVSIAQSHWDEAVLYSRQALAADQNFAPARIDLGVALTAMGRPKLALPAPMMTIFI